MREEDSHGQRRQQKPDLGRAGRQEVGEVFVTLGETQLAGKPPTGRPEQGEHVWPAGAQSVWKGMPYLAEQTASTCCLALLSLGQRAFIWKKGAKE